MESLLGICFVFAVGTAGFLVFARLKLPNPALLGSMFATGTLSVLGYFPVFSTTLISFAANILIGVMVGKEIDRNVVKRIFSLLSPVLIQTAGMIVLSVVCGYVLYLFGDGQISLATALISGAAGGIAEMMVFGMAINADVAVIAFVQLFRVVIFLSLIPYISVVCEKIGGAKPPPRETRNSGLALFNTGDYWLLTLFAFAGGLAGRWLRIPNGEMLGGMFAGGAWVIIRNKTYRFDARLRYFAQIALGMVMGQRITPGIVEQLGSMIVPGILVTVVMLVGSTLLAILLHLKTKWDYTTCLLCAAPAGIGQITVFAEEIGVDTFTASVFHTVRIVTIVSIYPWLILPFV